MVFLYKSAKKINLLLLGVAAFLLFIPSLYKITLTQYDDGYFLYHFLMRYLPHQSSGWSYTAWAIGVVFVFLQACYINFLCIRYHLMPYRSFLPGYAYLLLSALVQSPFFMSPLFIAMLFILASFHCFLRGYASHGLLHYFNGSLYSSFAFLLAPVLIPWVFTLIVNLTQNRAIQLRAILLFLLGIIIPYYFIFSILYLFDIPAALNYFYILNFFPVPGGMGFSSDYEAIALALFFTIIIVGIYFLFADRYWQSSLNTRKTLQITIWVFVSGVVSLLLYSTPVFNTAMLLLPGSICLSLSWIEIKNGMMSELYHLFVLAAVAGLNLKVLNIL